MTKTVNVKKNQELPEILYEAPSYPGEEVSGIPYIDSDKDTPMPMSLFIFEYQDTGEIEPDEKGKPAKIIDQIPHQYIDMVVLKQVLTARELDRVRVSLGMKPLQQAKKEGKIVLDKVMKKEEELREAAKNSQESRVEAHKIAIEKMHEKVKEVTKAGDEQ